MVRTGRLSVVIIHSKWFPIPRKDALYASDSYRVGSTRTWYRALWNPSLNARPILTLRIWKIWWMISKTVGEFDGVHDFALPLQCLADPSVLARERGEVWKGWGGMLDRGWRMEEYTVSLPKQNRSQRFFSFLTRSFGAEINCESRA